MPFPPEVLLATRNPGKTEEILRICRDWPVRWVTFRDASWPAVEETGDTYLENALIKGRAAASALGIPAVADDSGIEVDALAGEPGPHSARFAGPGARDEENLRLLLDRMLGATDRGARYRCVAALVWPGGDEIWREGLCEGTLLQEPRGSGGFGYDPVFVPEQRGGSMAELERQGRTMDELERQARTMDELERQGRTMAELEPEEKDRVSHRGRAFRALGEALRR